MKQGPSNATVGIEPRGVAAVLLAILLATAPGAAQGVVRYAYVAGTATSLNERVIAVYELSSSQVVAGLVTGIDVRHSVGGLAVNRAGTRVFVSDTGREVVREIDVATNTVRWQLPVQRPCCAMALAGDNSLLVASFLGLTVIDLPSRSIVATISMGASNGLAVSPDGTRAYATQVNTDRLSILDLQARRSLGDIAVGDQPRDVVLSPDGTRAYVSNYGGNSVSVVDTTSRAVVATIPVPAGPDGLSLTSDGSQLAVVSRTAMRVSVIDTATSAVVRSVGNTQLNIFLFGPRRILVASDGQRAYVTNNGGRSVVALTYATLQPAAAPVWVGNSPSQIVGSEMFAGGRSPGPAGCVADGSLVCRRPLECQDDFDCGSPGSCDPFSECDIDTYVCKVNPRSGYRSCQHNGFCPSCQSGVRGPLKP